METGKGKPIRVVKVDDFVYERVSKKQCTRNWAYKNYDRIFRLSPAGGGLMKKITPQLPRGISYIEYVPEKGKYEGEKVRIYFIDKQMVVLLSETSVHNTREKIVEKQVNIHNNWTDESLWQGIAKEGGVTLKHGKKPEELARRIIELATSGHGDIVVDFFLGSGTTCAVAHKMGRQYIGIEQLDYDNNDGVIRLKNVINGDQTGISKKVNWKEGGDFVFMELAKWNENFVEQIKKVKSGKELQKLWETLKEKAHLNYKVDIAAFDKNAKDFVDLSLKDQKHFLLETLDQNHLYINCSEIDDGEYGVSEEDKKLNKEFYG